MVRFAGLLAFVWWIDPHSPLRLAERGENLPIQFFYAPPPQGYHFRYSRGGFAFGGFYSAPVYESHVYFYQWIPPRHPLRGADEERAVRPRGDAFPTVDDFAPAIVDAAVKRGDLRVFKPGEKIAPPPPPLPKPPVEATQLAQYLTRRGDEAFDRGDYGRAGERYRAALALRPNQTGLWFRLTRAHLNRGEIPEALSALASAWALMRRFDAVESWLRK